MVEDIKNLIELIANTYTAYQAVGCLYKGIKKALRALKAKQSKS